MRVTHLQHFPNIAFTSFHTKQISILISILRSKSHKALKIYFSVLCFLDTLCHEISNTSHDNRLSLRDFQSCLNHWQFFLVRPLITTIDIFSRFFNLFCFFKIRERDRKSCHPLKKLL